MGRGREGSKALHVMRGRGRTVRASPPGLRQRRADAVRGGCAPSLARSRCVLHSGFASRQVSDEAAWSLETSVAHGVAKRTGTSIASCFDVVRRSSRKQPKRRHFGIVSHVAGTASATGRQIAAHLGPVLRRGSVDRVDATSSPGSLSKSADAPRPNMRAASPSTGRLLHRSARSWPLSTGPRSLTLGMSVLG